MRSLHAPDTCDVCDGKQPATQRDVIHIDAAVSRTLCGIRYTPASVSRRTARFWLDERLPEHEHLCAECADAC